MKVEHGEVSWRAGYRPAIAADVAHGELEKIRKVNGGDMSPAVIVEAATPEDSALHPAFTWDDSAAANAFREAEARSLVRSLVVVVESAPNEPMNVYVSVPFVSEEQPLRRAYRLTEDVLADPKACAELVERAKEELVRVRHRYSQVKELAGVWRAVDKVLAEEEVLV